MSGIAGYCSFRGESVDRALLGCMVGRLAHRGGDGAQLWAEGEAALGIERLCLMPEERCGDLSLQDESGNRAVFDGRLDNRPQIFAALGVPPGEWGHLCNGQLLLLAWREWDERCLEHIQGDFAFALWDARRHQLFCARDRIGVRPFYYAATPAVFCFASEIKALLAHPAIHRNLDELRIANYLHAHFEDKQSTFFRAIRRLPPGECLMVSADGLQGRRYWNLPEQPAHLVAEEAVSSTFRAALQQSVHARLQTDQPLGFLISGGLDSSSVLALAHRENDQRKLRTLFATFPDFPLMDESNWLLILAGEILFENSPVRVDQLSPVSLLDEIYEHLDEPFHFPNLFIYWALAREAQKQGIRVLLDGLDGDTTVSHGMEYLAELFGAGRWGELVRQARALGKNFHQPASSFLLHFALAPFLRRALNPFRLRFSGLSRTGILNPAFARRIHWREYAGEYDRQFSREPLNVYAAHRRQLESGIIPYNLEVYDQAAAVFGLDHRHPYYDARLIELALRAPPSCKLRQGQDRALQREALRGLLPESIRLRISKSNWSENFERSLLKTDAAKIQQILAAPGPLAQFVDGERLRHAARRMLHSGHLTVGDGMFLWTALSLGSWLKNC